MVTSNMLNVETLWTRHVQLGWPILGLSQPPQGVAAFSLKKYCNKKVKIGHTVTNWQFNFGEITVRPKDEKKKLCYTSFSWKFYAEFKSKKSLLRILKFKYVLAK